MGSVEAAARAGIMPETTPIASRIRIVETTTRGLRTGTPTKSVKLSRRPGG